jgi:hypothetical protein
MIKEGIVILTLMPMSQLFQISDAVTTVPFLMTRSKSITEEDCLNLGSDISEDVLLQEIIDVSSGRSGQFAQYIY